MSYLEFVDSEYTGVRKELLRDKGSKFQRAFLEATRESETFVEWIQDRINLEDLSKDSPFDLWAERISESEFKEPPKLIEKKLYSKWKDLSPAQASQETFWGHVTLEHIKKGIIESHYLAANGGNLPGGLQRIDKELSDGTDQAIDSIVRTILRRLSGLPEARGAKSVYVNCPFARAWWRGYIADEVCNETEADPGKVTKTLAKSQEYWERLIVLIVSRNSVLGDTSVRTALIWALSEMVDDESKSHLFTGKALKDISRQIGIRSAWQELGVFSVKELKPLLEAEVIPVATGG